MMPPPARMTSAPWGGAGMPAATWASPEAATVTAPRPMPMRELAASSWGDAQQAQAEEEEAERHGIRDAAEGARHHGVDDVAQDTLERPPLPGRDEDGHADEEEADAVAAVLRVQLAGAAADAAHGAAGHVRDAHPGALDRAQRQREPAAAGLAAGRRLAGRAGLAVRGPRCGAATARGARRGGRTSRHASQGTRPTHRTHVSHAPQTPRVSAPSDGSRSAASAVSRDENHRPPAGYLAGAAATVLAQVMSVSAKPRLADQQPSSAVGCSG